MNIVFLTIVSCKVDGGIVESSLYHSFLLCELWGNRVEYEVVRCCVVKVET